MIKSFRDKNTRKLYFGQKVNIFQNFYRQAIRRLQILDDATSLDDLRLLPSNHFQALGGNRKEQFSIRINHQWRICFEWDDGDAFHVEIVDYH
jgi:proteic killer suppression protein